jgi:CheY-like chemotaxis protein
MHPDDTDCISYHLTKPVRQTRLIEAIAAVIGARAPRPEPAAATADGDGGPAPARAGGRVLVVEDQSVNWMVIERYLAKRGWDAVNATDGRAALARLESEQFDLVLLDCQMPVLDGYDTAREIRRREAAADGGHVPIVAMTASAMEGDRERCLDAGMDDYLAKPMGPDKLDQVLARWSAPTAAA